MHSQALSLADAQAAAPFDPEVSTMAAEELSGTQVPGTPDSPSSSPVEAAESEEQILTTKRELRKILREDSNWSPRSILITALTGVSAALISTQLNGIVSSVVLIAIMAFITASISEIYRVFLALTGLGARKAAARAAKVIPLPLAPGSTPQPADSPGLTDPITEALEAVTGPYHLDELQEAQHPGIFRRMGYHIRNYGKANPFLWLVVLFFGIAATTLSVTYLLTDGEPPRIINRTVVTQQELSDSDRAAIVAEAKRQALAELQREQKSQPSAVPEAPTTVTPRSVEESLSSLQSQLSTMEQEIDGLKASQSTPIPTSAPPSSSSSASQKPLLDRISKLETERDSLSKQLQELEDRLAADEAAQDAAEGPNGTQTTQ